MADRIRTYTFTVVCPLPETRNGEPRSMKTYIYGVRTKTEARDTWFSKYLDMARKNGLRGDTEKLKAKLKLEIDRIAQRNDARLSR
jgi:hypothetical protein